MATKYPYDIDDNTSLPKLVDGVSPMVVEDINRLRDAVVAVQAELGADPSATATSVAGRFTTLENSLQNYASGTFLTLSANGYVSSERVFTPSSNFVAVDGGAGSSYNIDLASTVGIGTTSPAADYSLTLNGDGITRRGGLVLRQSGTDTFLIGNASASNSTDIQLLNPRTGYVSIGTSNIERFRISALGNVGVGTTSPSAQLHIKGNGQISRIETTTARGSGGSYLSFFDPTGEKGQVGYASSDDSLYVSNRLAAPIVFSSNDTERARITSDGKIGVGNSVPKEKLDVSGSIVLSDYLSWDDTHSAGAASISGSGNQISISPNGSNPVGSIGLSSSGLSISGRIISYDGSTPGESQILIGDGYSLAAKTLVSGAGITITSTPTQITLSSSLAGGTVTSVGISTTLSGITISSSPVTTSGVIGIGGTLGVANGGTGLSSLTANALLVGNGTSSIQTITGTSGQYLRHNGASWAPAALPSFVTGVTAEAPLSSSGGTAPNLTLGTVPANKGGTGQANYAIGDILYASGTTALSRLAGVATGSALISGGVGAAPSYGKIGLGTHVSGILPVGNGGTGTSTVIPTGRIILSGASGIYTHDSNLSWTATSAIITTSTTSNSSINIGTQSQNSGISKTINIGTLGASGSTTTISIGSSTNTTDLNLTGSTIDMTGASIDVGTNTSTVRINGSAGLVVTQATSISAGLPIRSSFDGSPSAETYSFTDSNGSGLGRDTGLRAGQTALRFSTIGSSWYEYSNTTETNAGNSYLANVANIEMIPGTAFYIEVTAVGSNNDFLVGAFTVLHKKVALVKCDAGVSPDGYITYSIQNQQDIFKLLSPASTLDGIKFAVVSTSTPAPNQLRIRASSETPGISAVWRFHVKVMYVSYV